MKCRDSLTFWSVTDREYPCSALTQLPCVRRRVPNVSARHSNPPAPFPSDCGIGDFGSFPVPEGPGCEKDLNFPFFGALPNLPPECTHRKRNGPESRPPQSAIRPIYFPNLLPYFHYTVRNSTGGRLLFFEPVKPFDCCDCRNGSQLVECGRMARAMSPSPPTSNTSMTMVLNKLVG